MTGFFNEILNTLVRNVDYTIRVFISLALFALCLFFFMKCIRRKNDKYPIAWGTAFISAICAVLSIVYVAL